ncbi:MAG: EAL domain-containing protein [Acidimicrobiales bacterium]|nr:EAL domain-containing protein [Acidimicrobiales bacterium]
MTSTSLHQLVGLLSVFSLEEADEVRSSTIDAAAEGFDAEVAGIVCDGKIITATGLGTAIAPVDFIALGESDEPRVDLTPLGPVHVLRVPIEGRVGTRFVVARSSDPFDDEELMLARAMVRVMRLAVRTIGAFEEQERTRAEADRRAAENSELADRLQQRHAELMRRFVRIQRLVSRRSTGLDALDAIAAEAGRLFDGAVVAVRLEDPSDHEVHLRSCVNAPDELVDILREDRRRDVGITGAAMTADQLVVSDAYVADQRRFDPMASVGVLVAMAAPLHLGGEVVGAVFVGSSEPGHRFDLEDQELLLILAGYMSVALNGAATLDEVRDALSQAEWQATHDPLTNLANRRMLREVLTDRLADPDLDPASLYVLFVDLDRFKSVNDLYGHATGDRVILEVADRLKQCLRPGDIVGRHAGDEFVVIVDGVDNEGATALARRITQRLDQPIIVNGRSIRLSASTGVTSAIDAAGADEVIVQADMAMYHAKTTHRGSIGYFDAGLRRQIRERVALEQRLKDAVPSMEAFTLAYQPMVNLTTGSLCGFEALLRWSDPELGEVSPAAFIPIAEESDLIAEIDLWVLREAVEEAAIWKELTDRPVAISVNVSAAAFTRPDFATHVAMLLTKHDVSSRQLSFEITERVMLGDVESSAAVVRQLQELGTRVVLDDFGTGYSSLAYLRHFHVDAIKIDRSFVAAVDDAEAAALVEAMVAMARALQSQTVAEGVETPAQRDRLQALGCDVGQGWLWGRPETAEAARQRLVVVEQPLRIVS